MIPVLFDEGFSGIYYDLDKGVLMTNDYAKNKGTSGKGTMASSLKYRVTVSDSTDTGSVMDTVRPMGPYSPYMDISANWDSVNNKGTTKGKA